MRKEKIIVDENTAVKIKEEEEQSAIEMNKGIGLWGQRALNYIFSDEPTWIMQCELESNGEKAINEYGKMIDKKAAELTEVMEEKLLALPEYKTNGDYMHDLQIHNAIKHIIEEELYSQLVYVKELVQA